MSEINNMELWNKVQRTNPSLTKSFPGKGGFKGTAISAMSQIKSATEQWGMYGESWGMESLNFSVLEFPDFHQNTLVLNAVFKHPKGKFPVATEIDMFYFKKGNEKWGTVDRWEKNNDIYKKVTTDAITKALSMLGFNADVFMGLYDDNKYVEQSKLFYENERIEKELRETSTQPNVQKPKAPSYQTTPKPMGKSLSAEEVQVLKKNIGLCKTSVELSKMQKFCTTPELKKVYNSKWNALLKAAIKKTETMPQLKKLSAYCTTDELSKEYANRVKQLEKAA